MQLPLRGKNVTYQQAYLSDVCSCKEFFTFRATVSRLFKKGESVDNTRLAAKMLLVPMNCFLCRVDYALEENVLTEQM